MGSESIDRPLSILSESILVEAPGCFYLGRGNAKKKCLLQYHTCIVQGSLCKQIIIFDLANIFFSLVSCTVLKANTVVKLNA
jgi:hypothetical protein